MKKKNEPPFVVLYLQSYVLFCSVCVCVCVCVRSPWLRTERTFRLSALVSLPLGLFMLSFTGSINIRTGKMNWVNPLQISTSIYSKVQHGTGFRLCRFKFFRNPTEVPLWLAVCSFAYKNELKTVLLICYTTFAIYMCMYVCVCVYIYIYIRVCV